MRRIALGPIDVCSQSAKWQDSAARSFQSPLTVSYLKGNHVPGGRHCKDMTRKEDNTLIHTQACFKEIMPTSPNHFQNHIQTPRDPFPK